MIDRKKVGVPALSAATGIPRSTLHKKLSGDSPLTVADLVQLAIALDVPAAELIAVAVESSGGDDAGTQAP